MKTCKYSPVGSCAYKGEPGSDVCLGCTVAGIIRETIQILDSCEQLAIRFAQFSRVMSDVKPKLSDELSGTLREFESFLLKRRSIGGDSG